MTLSVLLHLQPVLSHQIEIEVIDSETFENVEDFPSEDDGTNYAITIKSKEYMLETQEELEADIQTPTVTWEVASNSTLDVYFYELTFTNIEEETINFSKSTAGTKKLAGTYGQLVTEANGQCEEYVVDGSVVMQVDFSKTSASNGKLEVYYLAEEEFGKIQNLNATSYEISKGRRRLVLV